MIENRVYSNGIIIVFISLFMLGLSLGARDLWAPDEPRYAGIAREMMAEGRYFLPSLNGEDYYNKPPGYFWLIILCSLPTGEVTDVTARLPSVFLGTGLVGLLYLWVRKYKNDAIAVNASLILISTYLFTWFGSRVNIDISFTFFISLACMIFYSAFYDDCNRRFLLLIFGYLSVGMGLIIKGPFALLPVGAILAYLLVSKRFSEIKQLRLHFGLLIIFIPVLIWLIPAYLSGGWNYIDHAIIEQVFGRIVNSYSHAHPFYYYFYQLPATFLPWSIFLIVGLVSIIRKKIPLDSLLTYSLCWFGVIFFVMSCISAKQPHYLLPLFPPAAIITGQLIQRAELKATKLAYKITVFILILVTVAILILPIFIYPELRIFGVVLFCPLALICFLSVKQNTESVSRYSPVKLIFLFFFIINYMASIYLIPMINPIKSMKTVLSPYLASQIQKPEDELLVYTGPDDWSYYLPFFVEGHVQVVRTVAGLSILKQNAKDKFCLFRENDYEVLSLKLKKSFPIVLSKKIGSKKYVLTRVR